MAMKAFDLTLLHRLSLHCYICYNGFLYGRHTSRRNGLFLANSNTARGFDGILVYAASKERNELTMNSENGKNELLISFNY